MFGSHSAPVGAIPIDRNHLRAVKLFAAEGDIRFYLNGVLVHVLDDGAVRLVATDGRAIAITHTPTDDLIPPSPCKLIVPIDVVKIFAAHKGKTPISIFSRDGLEYRMECLGLSVNFVPIEGRFPEYERVVPARISGETAQFDPELMMRFNGAAKVYNKESRGIGIEHNGNGGALVHLNTGEFLGICMPWGGGHMTGVPAWIKPGKPLPKPDKETEGLPGIRTAEEIAAEAESDKPLATAGDTERPMKPDKRARGAKPLDAAATH